MSDLRSQIAIARDEWLDSQEGMKAGDPTTLPRAATASGAYYLRNRLSLAFVAGMQAALRLQQTEPKRDAK